MLIHWNFCLSSLMVWTSPHLDLHILNRDGERSSHLLKLKVLEVREYMITNKLSLFTKTEEHKAEARHMIQRTQRFPAAAAKAGFLAKYVFVQMVKCITENKNRFVFVYSESLVARGLLYEVTISVLPVGHTHWDVYQDFSYTSGRLRSSNSTTLDDLQAELFNVYTEDDKLCKLEHIVSFPGVCFEQGCLQPVPEFSHFQYFRLMWEPDSSLSTYRDHYQITYFVKEIVSYSTNGRSS